jgi:hypothetical protein
MTPEVIKRLDDALRDGANITQACLLAGISQETYYLHVKTNPVFAETMESAKNWLNVIAKKNLADALKDNDKETSKWWIERKEKQEFSPRSEITGSDGQSVIGYVHSGDLPKSPEAPILKPSGDLPPEGPQPKP